MKAVKIILALLAFGCLAPMPYGYYGVVRVCALVGFLFLAYKSNLNKNKVLPVIYVFLAILFQPFFKFVIHRDQWHVIDVIVGVFLLVMFLFEKER